MKDTFWDRVLDWGIIVGFPIGMWDFWTTENTGLLRAVAIVFLIDVTLGCIADRLKARESTSHD